MGLGGAIVIVADRATHGKKLSEWLIPTLIAFYLALTATFALSSAHLLSPNLPWALVCFFLIRISCGIFASVISNAFDKPNEG